MTASPLCMSLALLDKESATRLATTLAALGDPTRLSLAIFIYQSAPAPVCASSFAEVFAIGRSTLTHHLTKLVDAGIVARTRRGNWAYYAMDPNFDPMVLRYLGERYGPRPVKPLHSSDATVTMEKPVLLEAGKAAPVTDAKSNPGPSERKRKPRIFFVGVQNSGRSQMAASIARALAADSAVVFSAGTDPYVSVLPSTVRVLQEIGMRPVAGPRKLSPAAIGRADWVITMDCIEDCPVSPGVCYENWSVPDPMRRPVDVVRDIRNDIYWRVEDLLARVAA